MDIVYPKITIVTPSFNQGDYLESTIRSVIDQGYPNLEYIIIDGGSTDNSIDIIKKYASHLAYWVSEPDKGQYYAIDKGLRMATGEIMAWLNSDDMFHSGSLFTIASLFQENPDVEWLMGYPTFYTEDGYCFIDAYATIPYWSRYRYYAGDHKYIQQESVSWRSSLWKKAGGFIDTDYKYAADMELWARFFRYAKLDATPYILSGFRIRNNNQASFNYKDQYTIEAKRIIKNEREILSVSQRMAFACHFLFYTFLRSWITVYRILIKKHIRLFGSSGPLPVKSR